MVLAATVIKGTTEKHWRINLTIFEMDLSIKFKIYTTKSVNYIRKVDM